MIDDFDLIVSSFQDQYGIRLSRELKGMKWDEFRDLLVGISPETALGRIVAIRAENNKDNLRHFSKQQHKIRNEWRMKRSRKISKASSERRDEALEAFKNAFIGMARKDR